MTSPKKNDDPVEETGHATEPSSLGTREVKDVPLVETKPTQYATMAEQLADGPKETLVIWLQALSAFLIYAGTWGLLAAYGTYQNYYETVLLPDTSTDKIAWVGTIAAILLIFGGVITGPIYDRGWVHELLFLGSFLTILGIMMTSLATEYWQILLAQGLCLGLGSGILSNPAIALVTSSFSGNRTLALGLATAGTSIAGTVYPIILPRLFASIGFRWATRVLGFITLGELVLALAIMLPYAGKSRRQQSEQKRSLSDLLSTAPFKDAGFMAVSFGFFFMWIGFWAVSFFIPTFATFKLGATGARADDCLVIFNAVSLLGRLLPVVVSNKWGVPRTLPWFALASAIMLLGWTGIRSMAAYYVWIVLMAILLTPLGVLCPSMLAHVSPSKDVMGTRMGIAFGFTSIGVLLGTPVSSLLIDREAGSFWKMQVFTGITMLAGAASMAFAAREVALKATKPDKSRGEKS